MQVLLDSSLEVHSQLDSKSAPPQRVRRRRKKNRNDESIDQLIMGPLQRYFAKPDKADILWEQLNDLKDRDKTTKISLRVIDWFVTNYSKKHSVYFKLKKKDHTCIVWQEYKQKLKGFSKQRFDPFCRHKRIRFHLSHGRTLLTTVGQLNFFRWVIENEIMDYIWEHKEAIEKDMNDTYQIHYSMQRRPDMKGDSRKPRRKISQAPSGVCLVKV